MKYIMLQYWVLTLIIFSCEGVNVANKSKVPVEVTTEALDLDSLYRYYFAERPNDYSTEAIIERGKIYPRDAAPLDSSFLVFRGQLLEVLRQKDLIALLPLLDLQIDCGTAGTGRSAFARLWGLDDPDGMADSPFWEALAAVLQEGGSFDRQGRFLAPYVFAQWPDSYTTAEYALVDGGMVRMRAEPRLGAPIVTNLSHAIVQVVDPSGPQETIGGATYPWWQITTLDGRNGYVWGQFMRSPEDPRAGFALKDGQWKMIFFLPGAR